MTPQEQQIALCEWMGWKGCVDVRCPYRKAQHMHKDDMIAFPEWYCTPRLPDTNSLDVLHEMEKKLFPTKVWQLNDPDKYAEYEARLEGICVGHPGGMTRATASQRREALLKCLGLWRD